MTSQLDPDLSTKIETLKCNMNDVDNLPADLELTRWILCEVQHQTIQS